MKAVLIVLGALLVAQTVFANVIQGKADEPNDTCPAAQCSQKGFSYCCNCPTGYWCCAKQSQYCSECINTGIPGGCTTREFLSVVAAGKF